MLGAATRSSVTRIQIRYQDVDANAPTEESDSLRAVCHQHEIDQLNGEFWIGRLSRLKRERLVKKFEKVARRSSGGLAQA
jgi:peptide deformylase